MAAEEQQGCADVDPCKSGDAHTEESEWPQEAVAEGFLVSEEAVDGSARSGGDDNRQKEDYECSCELARSGIGQG